MRPLDYALQVRIEHKVYAIARAMVKTDVLNRHKPDFRKWGEYIYSVLEPEFKHMPQSRFGLARSVWVDSVAGVGFISDPYSYSLKESWFPVEFSSDKPWPNFLFVEGLALKNTWTELVLFDHPVWHGLRDELAAYNAVVERYYLQRRAFVDGIMKICGHYDTLNEALAAWPSLRFFLPENMRNCEYPFSGQPKPLPEDVDVAKLTATVVRLKLEG